MLPSTATAQDLKAQKGMEESQGMHRTAGRFCCGVRAVDMMIEEELLLSTCHRCCDGCILLLQVLLLCLQALLLHHVIAAHQQDHGHCSTLEQKNSDSSKR